MSSPSLLQLPPGLVDMRERLFSLKDPVVFGTHEDYKRYWSFVDNFWTRSRREWVGNVLVEHYRCLLHSTQERTSVPAENRKRQRSVRTPIGCKISLRKDFYPDGRVKIRRCSESKAHCHDLQELDLKKVNSALRAIVCGEVRKGYTVQEIHGVLQRHYAKDLLLAGGAKADRKYIHNVSRQVQKQSGPGSQGCSTATSPTG
ncbi:hypothetical protein VTN31DRAFT_433 [Thermomyces dupontii]|uniref:uncharacterized protein n=1 Tax=Talaromyces thermophilus TaxID=28565 RepID=UPI003743274C